MTSHAQTQHYDSSLSHNTQLIDDVTHPQPTVREGGLLSGAAKAARIPPSVLPRRSSSKDRKDTGLSGGRGLLPAPPKVTDHRNGGGALPPLPGGGARGMHLPPTPGGGGGGGGGGNSLSYAEMSAAELNGAGSKADGGAVVLEDAGGLYCTNPLAFIQAQRAKEAGGATGSGGGGGGAAAAAAAAASASASVAPEAKLRKKALSSSSVGGSSEDGEPQEEKKKKNRLSMKSLGNGLKKLTLKRGAKLTSMPTPKENDTLEDFEV